MNDIYQILDENVLEKKDTQQTRMPKEEYAKMMSQKRDELYQMAEKQTYVVAGSPQNYLKYLELQSKLDYTVTNTLLVMSQKPDATLLKDSTHWRQDKHYIRKNETGIKILEPNGEYQRQDGTIGINYKVKYVFDVSQINGKVIQRNTQIPMRSILSALLYDTPIKLQRIMSNEYTHQVIYSPEQKTIFYKDNLDAGTLLHGLAREFCYAEFDKQYDGVDRKTDGFIAESTAYMICKKYGIETKETAFANEVNDYFDGVDSKDIKEELGNIKNLYDDVSRRMERGIYKQQQEKVNTQDIGR